MPLEQGERACAVSAEREQALSLTLLDLAGSESVRVIEALAAALVNDLHERAEEAPGNWPVAVSYTGLCEDGRVIEDFGGRLGLCRRVARRALRGSLTDPTRGANAFHRIEASPDWARELLPVAVYGPYLFYRR
jgi:N-acetylmuramoyl-L-alanine amidase